MVARAGRTPTLRLPAPVRPRRAVKLMPQRLVGPEEDGVHDTLDILALLSVASDSQSTSAHLQTGPAPLRLLLAEEDVSRNRSLACPEYDGCLDAAYRQRWRSWTCESCRLFPLAAIFRSLEACSMGDRRSSDSKFDRP